MDPTTAVPDSRRRQIQNQILEGADSVIRADVPTYARSMSGGDWLPYDHAARTLRYVAQRVRKGGARIIINEPPRHGKSERFTGWLPTWFLDLYPRRHVILSMYEAKVASDWGRRVRDQFIQNPRTWTRVREDARAAHRWQTLRGGGMLTAGIGGPITGKGFHLGIVDDPIKNWKQAHSQVYQQELVDWWRSTFYTRAEPGASILVTHTRWTDNDLAGWLKKTEPDIWELIDLPAIALADDWLGREPGEPLCPERYPLDELERIRTAVGPTVWAGMYQQQPAPLEGTIIKADWVQLYKRKELPASFDTILFSWDLKQSETKSSSSSYVVGQVWGSVGRSDEMHMYLLDQFRDRIGFLDALVALENQHTAWPMVDEILVEAAAQGTSVIEVARNRFSNVVPIRPDGSKDNRLRATEPEWAAGRVHIPDPEDDAPGVDNSWVNDYLEEILHFPHSRFNDQVDCTSQALLRFKRKDPGGAVEENLMMGGLVTPSYWKM